MNTIPIQRLRRQTHKVCLNCGSVAESYKNIPCWKCNWLKNPTLVKNISSKMLTP